MPAIEVRTPFSRSAAQQILPDTWRKKVLPVGEVEYKGRMLHFTPDYLRGLAASFSERAYDQVPFQIADAGNAHTNDPERYRGEIVRVDVEPDGLYVTAKTTPEGSKLLLTNPKLGVSARIVEGYQRSDGKQYEAALQHVLGTLDPRIPGLGAWEAVEMSNGSRPEFVIDLSEATFAGEEGGTMPDLTPEQAGRLARLLELDPDKLDAAITALESNDDGADDGADGDLSDEELAAWIENMPDEEFAALADEFPELVGADAGAGAGAPELSNTYGYGGELEMANYQLAEQGRQLAAMQAEMDRQRFDAEKRRLADLGIPPFITELARPLLEGNGHVIEMSNGQGVDAGQVMRKVLTEFGKAASLLDLSGEIGSAADDTPDSSEAAATSRADFVKRYKSMTGLG